MPETDRVAPFITRWSTAAHAERANYVSFLKELCDLLDVPHPEPATADHARNAYVFERAVPMRDDITGDVITGFIDLYKRGCFILEAKQYDLAPAHRSPPAAPWGQSGHAMDRRGRQGRRPGP
jgi:hypothetical protein